MIAVQFFYIEKRVSRSFQIIDFYFLFIYAWNCMKKYDKHFFYIKNECNAFLLKAGSVFGLFVFSFKSRWYSRW